MNLDEALDWIARVKPKRAILTNLHSRLDYEALRRQAAAACRAGIRRDGVSRHLKVMTRSDFAVSKSFVIDSPS